MTSVILLIAGASAFLLLRKGEMFAMLLSFALIFLCGILLGGVFEKLKLPRLLGMLLVGIALGPHALNLIDRSVLSISADLRQIALIIILARAGLNLDTADLKKVGRPAMLMCFVPASFEIAGMLLLAPKILGISLIEAAVLGTVIAAVSPAVVVPKMLKLMDEGYGTDKGIPQLILAGASVDDVFVIVLFTSCTGLASSGSFSALNLMRIPTAIILGILGGIICGLALKFVFQKAKIRDSLKILVMLSAAFLLVTLENSVKGAVGFSGLLAVMSMGITLRKSVSDTADRLSAKFSKLWIGAEILLFVLVGAAVDVEYALKSGAAVVALILGALVFRMVGVLVCLIKTPFSRKERAFCMLAYTPKATVQAAIGSIPLSMGLSCGNIVLTAAVTAILITAPLGAFAIDVTYKKWLTKTE